MKPGGITRKVASKLGGYDIFISYRHLDAEDYAEKLHRLLEDKGLIVFRDESERDNLGTSIEEFVKLACSARCLVTIVTAGVYESGNVYDELSGYLTNRIDRWYRRPFSRIISVNVDQALSLASSKQPNWGRLSNFVYEPEELVALKAGTPSPAVVKKLADVGSFMNSWRRFLTLILLSVFFIVALTAGTLVYLNSLRKDISSTQTRLNTISDSTKKLSKTNRSLVSRNNGLQEQTNRLEHQEKKLQKRSDSLAGQGKMLDIRIAAMNQLPYDPLIAYRLAQQAYAMSPDQENRKLIMASLSKIDLYYKTLIDGYTVENVNEPYVLLVKGKTKSGKNLFVLNLDNLKIEPVNVKTELAWIVPVKKTWRLLTEKWSDNGDDSYRECQLWDNTGKAISPKIKKVRLTKIQFLDKTSVAIDLFKGTKKIVWNLVTNKTEIIQLDTSNDDGKYFYNIYGAFASRKDGSFAAHYKSGLILTDNHGMILKSSYTDVEFDPAFTAGSWSADGKCLALNYYGDGDQKRLGIWNPAAPAFKWLDPQGWIVDTYAWSSNGHILAYAGRTENDIDVTLQIIDPDSPERSKKVIYNGSAPIESIIFLNKDKDIAIADLDGIISVIDISTGIVLRKGFQKKVANLYALANNFISSSLGDVRFWATKPVPYHYWSFESSKRRVYSAMGAADPSFRWLAAPYQEAKTNRGVEIRSVLTGERKDLISPKDLNYQIEFSQDGKWLILETFDTVRIWKTTTWDHYDFPSWKKAQFNGFHIDNNEVITNTSDKDYTIDLNHNKPILIIIPHNKRNSDKEYRSNGDAVRKDVEGWESGKLYKYLAEGLSSAPKSGWAVYVKCRDQPLGAQDCDVQFIPIDIPKLMALYDNLLWKPTEKELQAVGITKSR